MKQVKSYIERKSMLGKNGSEPGDYAMNYVFGCANGCKIRCGAFMSARRFGRVDSYGQWIEPSLVGNTIELLDREIPRLKSKIRSVNLCLSSDPFMYGYDEIGQVSLEVIRRLNGAGIKCKLLTKGLLPEVLAGFSMENEYGIRLVSLDEDFRSRFEPGTAPYRERIAALRRLHEFGCKTCAAIEHYPTPNLVKQELHDILDALAFVDYISFGCAGRSKFLSSYPEYGKFYAEQVRIFTEYCDKHGIKYQIK